mgnify:CR=1 FL=1
MVTDISRAARALGMELQVVEARQRQELARAFEAMTAAKAHAVVVLPDAMFVAERRRIVELAATSRMPAIYQLREFAEVGGLISYGPDRTESLRQSAVLVDKILRGANPRDLPIEQASTFELVINLKTAKALGLTIPPSLLARADQIIDQ